VFKNIFFYTWLNYILPTEWTKNVCANISLDFHPRSLHPSSMQMLAGRALNSMIVNNCTFIVMKK
jgi:AAA15 family ATPase/GTPase